MFSAQLTLFCHIKFKRAADDFTVSACHPRFGEPVLTAIRSNTAALQATL